MSNVTAWTRKHFMRSCNAGQRSRKNFQKFWPVAAWNLKPRVKILTRKPSQCVPANIRAICCNASKISLGSDLRPVLHFGRNHTQKDQRFSAREVVTPALRLSAQNLILQ